MNSRARESAPVRPVPYRPRPDVILDGRDIEDDDFRALVDGLGNALDLVRAIAGTSVETITELRGLTEADFSRCRGIGPQRARDVKKALGRFGWTFASDEPPAAAPPKLTKHQEAMAELARLASNDSEPLQEIDQWLLPSVSTAPSTRCSSPASVIRLLPTR